jgi:hypothetical protein
MTSSPEKQMFSRAVGEETKVLDEDTLKHAVEALKQQSSAPFPLYWVDNRHFYLGEYAKPMGFSCTEDEIDSADEKGFIKTAGGVDLYLTRLLSSTSN